MDSDMGFFAKFHLKLLLYFAHHCVGIGKGFITIHSDVYLDGDMVSDTACTQVVGCANFWK